MNKHGRRQGMQTRLIHSAQVANDTTAVSPPIFQTSTFVLRTPEEGAELAEQVAPAAYYTRYGSPNTKQVEAPLAELEGSEAALAVGSGMAAITIAIMANVQAGGHVIAQNTHYTAAMSLLAHTMPRICISGKQADHRPPTAFPPDISPYTKINYP